MLHIELENIPKEVHDISDKWIAIGDKIKAALASSTVVAIESLIPNGVVITAEISTVIDLAEKALQALQAIGDDDGLKGRIGTLVHQIVMLETGGVHMFGDIVKWVQTIFNHKKA